MILVIHLQKHTLRRRDTREDSKIETANTIK